MQREATETEMIPGDGAPEGRVLRLLYLLSGPLILAFALLVAVPNVFVIDGAVYYAMADAMAREGSFHLERVRDLPVRCP